MRTKCRSIATFHRPIHSHWSLPLTESTNCINSWYMWFLSAVRCTVGFIWRNFVCVCPVYHTGPHPSPPPLSAVNVRRASLALSRSFFHLCDGQRWEANLRKFTLRSQEHQHEIIN
jgi:hypothetical protein